MFELYEFWLSYEKFLAPLVSAALWWIDMVWLGLLPKLPVVWCEFCWCISFCNILAFGLWNELSTPIIPAPEVLRMMPLFWLPPRDCWCPWCVKATLFSAFPTGLFCWEKYLAWFFTDLLIPLIPGPPIWLGFTGWSTSPAWLVYRFC